MFVLVTVFLFHSSRLSILFLRNGELCTIGTIWWVRGGFQRPRQNFLIVTHNNHIQTTETVARHRPANGLQSCFTDIRLQAAKIYDSRKLDWLESFPKTNQNILGIGTGNRLLFAPVVDQVVIGFNKNASFPVYTLDNRCWQAWGRKVSYSQQIEHQTITQNYSVLKKVENLDVKKKGGGRQFNFIRARGNCVLNANIRVTC